MTRVGAIVVASIALLAIASAVAWIRRDAVLRALPPPWRIAINAARFGIEVDHGVRLAMPDGKRLAASLYRARDAEARLPTVLIRLPYHRLRYGEATTWGLFFARHGYAVVVQDLRGSGDSEGELLPWRDAESDGVATLDWIVSQPWSDGRVGTFGCSALGETQHVLAKARHPAHRAMVASGAGGAVGSAMGRHSYFGAYEGGVPQLASLFGWFVDHGTKTPHAAPAGSFDRTRHLRNLPVASLVQSVRPGPNGFDDFLATPIADTRWASWGYLTEADTNPMPALIVNTWGDQTAGDTLAWAVAQQRAGAADQRVVMAPGHHCGHHAGERAFGRLPVNGRERPWGEWYLRFFDRHLRDRGEGLAALAPYQYFMLNEDRWRESQAWPPAEARIERWRLAGGGRANTRAGDGRLGPDLDGNGAMDTFTYDPDDPVPTRGGPICCTGNPADVPGPQDQADVEARNDVLVYTSEPLADDLRIAGPLAARIAFSSDAPDTDLVLRLAHVRPDGLSTNIQEGALRLRYRDGFVSPAMMQPGTRYTARVDLRSIAYLVPRGHRLRLHVTSSSFPRLERNLNTGAASNSHETRMQVARNTVHLDGEGSWLELPVLPGDRSVSRARAAAGSPPT